MQPPTLSILVPAYEYSFGVKRILDSILDSIKLDPNLSFECIVSDDSKTDKVERMVRAHGINEHENFRYFKRDNSLGAADNWNFLLESAKGDYVHFIHHDEFPESRDFFGSLVLEIKSRPLFDVIFLRCFVPTFIGNRFRPHVNSFLRYLYFLSPEGLFLRNTVGSPTCAVIRRDKLQLFDVRLHWIVDIDWYYRILVQRDIQTRFSRLNYISVYRSESISNELQSRVKIIDSHERQLVKLDYSAIFLDRFRDSSLVVYKFFILLEGFFWHSFRILSYPFGLIVGHTVDSDLLKGVENDCK